MRSSRVTFVFSLLGLIVAIESAAIPSYIHVCKKNDPHLEDCIVNSVEKLRPKLVKGIPELQVPALEPLILPEVVISRGGNFKAVGTNVIVTGASDFKITKLKADIDTIRYDIGIVIPSLTFKATYDVDMRLIVPIRGQGPINANATDIIGDAVLKGHKEKRKGVEYVKFDSMDVKLKISNYNVHLERLFNGDKALGEAVNLVLNDNKSELMKTVAPVAERVVGQVLLDISNKITKNIPYKDLFPDE